MRERGAHFEDLATAWAQGRGWHIVKRNYLCKCGEIDIIALDQECLVFIEVRARANPRFASAAASVDRRKQQKLLRTAATFLRAEPIWGRSACRFDVLAFETRQSAQIVEPLWIRSAFTT